MLFYFFIVAIVTGLRWYLIVLMCICLIVTDPEHLFMCCQPSVHLLWRNVKSLRIFGSGCWVVGAPHILGILTPTIRKDFLPFHMLLFHLVDCVLWCTDDFKFCYSQIYLFPFVAYLEAASASFPHVPNHSGPGWAGQSFRHLPPRQVCVWGTLETKAVESEAKATKLSCHRDGGFAPLGVCLVGVNLRSFSRLLQGWFRHFVCFIGVSVGRRELGAS